MFLNRPTALLTLVVVGGWGTWSTPNASAEVVFTFDASYQNTQGYQFGPLTNDSRWTGNSDLQLFSASTTGRVRNEAAGLNPAYHTTGVLDSVPPSSFGIGDRITINAQVQFDLAGSLLGQEVARFGFSRGTGGGPLEHGFGVAWDEGNNQPPEQYGNIRFYPDFNDYVQTDFTAPVNQNNSIGIQGRFAGFRPGDRQSRPFDITYATEHLGNNLWQVDTLSITDQQTNGTFFYDFATSPAQQFTFDGMNAFLGQDLAIQGRSANAQFVTSEFISISYVGNPVVAVPEPSLLGFFVPLLGGIRGRRYLRSPAP